MCSYYFSFHCNELCLFDTDLLDITVSDIKILCFTLLSTFSLKPMDKRRRRIRRWSFHKKCNLCKRRWKRKLWLNTLKDYYVFNASVAFSLRCWAPLLHCVCYCFFFNPLNVGVFSPFSANYGPTWDCNQCQSRNFVLLCGSRSHQQWVRFVTVLWSSPFCSIAEALGLFVAILSMMEGRRRKDFQSMMRRMRFFRAWLRFFIKACNAKILSHKNLMDEWAFDS